MFNGLRVLELDDHKAIEVDHGGGLVTASCTCGRFVIQGETLEVAKLVQGQHDSLAAEAAANRQRFRDTVDAKNAVIAGLEADVARLRKTITEQEDSYADLVQRCVGARGTRWAEKHGIC